MNIVYYCSDFLSFETAQARLLKTNPLIKKEQILWCNSNADSRLHFINKSAPGEWYLFLDHDCFVEQEEYLILLNSVKSYNVQTKVHGIVLVGRYKNMHPASILQRAHNWIANTWLDFSYDVQKTNPGLLGGAFAIKKVVKDEVDSSLKQGQWGAEDKKLASDLKKSNFIFNRISDFFILHDTSGTVKHFLKRAFLHGYNEDGYIQLSKNQENENFICLLSYWKNKIASLSYDLILPVLLHFFVQIVGRLIRIIRPRRKENK